MIVMFESGVATTTQIFLRESAVYIYKNIYFDDKGGKTAGVCVEFLDDMRGEEGSKRRMMKNSREKHITKMD